MHVHEHGTMVVNEIFQSRINSWQGFCNLTCEMEFFQLNKERLEANT